MYSVQSTGLWMMMAMCVCAQGSYVFVQNLQLPLQLTDRVLEMQKASVLEVFEAAIDRRWSFAVVNCQGRGE